MPKTVHIGTRGSQLALWQANWVKSALTSHHSSRSFEIVTIKTSGDKILDTPLAKVGGKGLFVKEIEDALLSGTIDLAVHSMKDMPSDVPEGLCIGAVPERETPADVLISRKGKRLFELAKGARIGTSSLRRAAQLKHTRPDTTIVPLRGNLDTRLRKLETTNLDAIVLAAAGVKRLGLEDKISEYLDASIMLPAVGQGALCIEIRATDAEIRELVGALDHPETRVAVLGERSFLKRLEGSCQVPVAGIGKLVDGEYALEGLVADIGGRKIVRDTLCGVASASVEIGSALADRLLLNGAKEILESLKAGTDEG
jgi:hydroxymethylbilane synthase